MKLVVTKYWCRLWSSNVLSDDPSINLKDGVICFAIAVEQCAWVPASNAYYVVCTEGSGWIYEGNLAPCE